MVQSALVEAMTRPDFYPHGPPRVDLIQTHISYVFLAGEEVYKVKKAVRLPFLDFSTLEQRRYFCQQEVALNRRLTTDVYLGVVGISPTPSGYRLTAENDPASVEYAVHMRRLPEERILSHLLARNEATSEMIDSLVDRLVEFHRHARSDAVVVANGDPERIRAVMENSFETTRRFRGRTIDASDDEVIQRFCLDFLRQRRALLHSRQAEHRIRDCHGDLHGEHVCFSDPIAIFDCIEFNERFRYCDVASEIAFLAMDLDFHGRPDLSRRFVSRYAEVARDAALPNLVPFYACHRAYVRGMVASLKSTEEEVAENERAAAVDRGRRYFALSYRYVWSYHPHLVVVAGLSGTGKSTLAIALRNRTGFLHLNSDIVRKELAGLDPRERTTNTETLYSEARTRQTYDTMFARAEESLKANHGVILDATFPRRADRDDARRLAERVGAPLLFVECRCDEDEIHRRLEDRIRSNRGPSDADWNIYLEQRRRTEPFTETGIERLVVETTEPLDSQTRSVERALLSSSRAQA